MSTECALQYRSDVMSRDLLPAFNATQATVDYYHAGGVLRFALEAAPSCEMKSKESVGRAGQPFDQPIWFEWLSRSS